MTTRSKRIKKNKKVNIRYDSNFIQAIKDKLKALDITKSLRNCSDQGQFYDILPVHGVTIWRILNADNAGVTNVTQPEQIEKILKWCGLSNCTTYYEYRNGTSVNTIINIK